MKCVAVTAALLFWIPVDSASAQEPSTRPAVALSTPDGTINVELDIRVDGRSPKVPWDEFLSRLFDFFDRNGDGSLAEAECTRLPRLPIPEKKELTLAFSGLDLDGSGGVSRSELTEFCSERGYSAVVIRRESPSSEDVRLSGVFQDWFDDNRDERISGNELRGVSGLMSRYDLDEDGAVALEELLGSSTAESWPSKSVAHGLTGPSAHIVRLEINLD